jgi:DNA-binding PucR family transcriptional regulator
MTRGRAAAALEVHPNTLDYRLGRIEELCGVRLADPHDIARIELALAQLEPEAT